MTDEKRVFIYGTCRKGGSNHDVLSDAICLDASARLPNAALYDFGPYPGVVRPDSQGDEGTSGSVAGELYTVGAAELEALDRMQDHPYLYQRVQETVLGENGKEITAWVYWYRHSVKDAERVPSGDYAARF